METSAHSVLYFIYGFAQGWLTPLLAVAISVIYFMAAPKTQSVVLRFVASAHGLSIAALFMGALFVHRSGNANPRFGEPFLLLSLLPLALIGGSFFLYRGKKLVHLLQIPNLLCLLWTVFVGSMAVTGNWL